MTSLNAPEPALRVRPAPAGAPAISFQDVSKRFPTAEGRMLEVLRSVSFDLPSAEIVAIVGPSGAGKSTLLNLAAGLILPDQGEVRVLGQATAGAVDWGRVGYMFQDDRLLPWRVALANVSLALEAGAMPAAERRRRARDALALVGLADFATAFPHQLSGGMRSRVALARSLVGEPDLLLMDEPFSRLDAQTRGTMHRELLRIHEMRRLSILFVTHDAEEAVVLADRIVVMSARPGQVRATLDVALSHPRPGTEGAAALVARLRAMLEETEETIR
ncbi:MAG TPA: ABC transporter ATP-binding protein [Xanthobacteraceae bacterium]|jgi:NitT/TauT family transport system ATP-binding protein|nr:ABC transporter ATP-binding protein [Xanthobacteraceae bacterium]